MTTYSLLENSNTRSTFKLVLPFLALDYAFITFSILFIFKNYGLTSVLVFSALQYLLAFGGILMVYHSNYSLKWSFISIYKASMLLASAGFGLCTLLLVLKNSVFLVGIICALMGILRGALWGCRHWFEINSTQGVDRTKYVKLTQSWSTLLKVGIPLLLALVIGAAEYLYNSKILEFEILFGLATIVCIAGFIFIRRVDLPDLKNSEKPQIFKTFFSSSFWEVGSFYMWQGAVSSLRIALYVSGLIYAVSNIKEFSLLDALFSAIAALVLIKMVPKVKKEKISLYHLKLSFVVMGTCWIVYLLSLKWTFLIVLFVIGYAFAAPFMNVVSSALVLKGLSDPGSKPENNVMARELLQTLSRLIGLSIGGAIAVVNPDPVWSISALVILMLILMPLEYRCAKKLNAI